MILPSFFKIRRSGIFGGWLSAGSEYNGFGYLLRDVPGNPKVQQNTYSEISFGLSYDCIFAKNIMFSLEGGYKSTLQNRILEVYKKYNDSSVEIHIRETQYIKAGLSWIIPNAKIKKEIQRAKN